MRTGHQENTKAYMCCCCQAVFMCTVPFVMRYDT